MDRRPLYPIQITNAEIASRNLPFTKNDLVINTDTGEVRVGEGYWNDLKSFNGQADVDMTVRVATTANITIASALVDGQTIDGIELAEGDLVLVKNQSSSEENGIYVAGAAPARSTKYDTMADIAGTLVAVTAGTANGGKLFRCTTLAGTLDTDPVAYAPVVQGSLHFAKLGSVAALPAKTAYNATDLVVLEQADGTVVKMALSDFKTNMA